MSQALGNFTPTPNEQQPKMSASILDVATTTTKAAAEEPSEREQRIYTLFKELNDEWMFVGDNAKRITKVSPSTSNLPTTSKTSLPNI